MKDKAKWVVMYCTMGVLVLCVAASTALCAFTFNNVSAIGETIDTYMSANEDVAQEDDVKIMNQYIIKSTLAISDAYKSGDKSQLEDKDKETLKMASDVLAEIIKKDMTDYEKELAVYKWMTTALTSDEGVLVAIPTTEADSDNPYGVLKNHNAVCVGYATTFRLFMQMLDIECMVVHSSDLTHTWNLTKLDGDWYHTDIYTDAENGNFANFNINDSMCTTGHSWNTEFFPKADGVKYNYAFLNCSEIKDIYDIPKTVKKAIDKKKGSLFISFKNPVKEADYAAAQSLVNGISERLGFVDETGELWMDSSWTTKDSATDYVLCVYITGYPDDDSELTKEQKKKVEKALNDAFGEGGEYYEGGEYIGDGTEAVG